VIHELLNKTRHPKMAGHEPKPVFWNMLIGGPNQSHKVNFKEPLPVMGKISKKTFRFISVNTFPEVFSKSFRKERLSFSSFDHHTHVLRDRVNRRDGGKCKPRFLYQDLFIRFCILSHNAFIVMILCNIYISVFGASHPKQQT
jgi:hypothetical protein